ncbi:hypothetical protein ACIBLA_34085 [Streptomyces sp. NPDC050433]|uniref:hypothetical protein n=1 Tax=Streptomyces sp. NPDC050433 TaxID=3365615 RepID=UPI0037B3546D
MKQTPTLHRQIAALQGIQSGLTKVLVAVAVVALAFTATNVTLFAIDHHISPWIAWLLDPMVAVALGAVLIVDGQLSEHGVYPSGWATALRWFAGLSTWLMNCWAALWPTGTPFGVPRDVDPAGLLLHSIPPVLLIVLAEAITHYRRSILARITELRALLDTQETPVDTTPVHPAPEPVSTPSTPTPVTAPAPMAAERKALVICGGNAVYAPVVPPASTPDPEDEPAIYKLPANEALNEIRTCWTKGETISQAAVKSTRSTSYVHKVYKRLNDSAAETADSGDRHLASVGGER